MKKYLILLQGKGALDYSENELQRRIDEYNAWVDTVKDHHLADQRLEAKGAHIRKKDTVVTDGPFLEAKEIIAGYIIIQAYDLDEAIRVAHSCPLLKYFEMYVRPMIV